MSSKRRVYPGQEAVNPTDYTQQSGAQQISQPGTFTPQPATMSPNPVPMVPMTQQYPGTQPIAPPPTQGQPYQPHQPFQTQPLAPPPTDIAPPPTGAVHTAHDPLSRHKRVPLEQALDPEGQGQHSDHAYGYGASTAQVTNAMGQMSLGAQVLLPFPFVRTNNAAFYVSLLSLVELVCLLVVFHTLLTLQHTLTHMLHARCFCRDPKVCNILILKHNSLASAVTPHLAVLCLKVNKDKSGFLTLSVSRR